jgi:hypothetical protein
MKKIKVTKKALANAIGGILNAAAEERKKDPEYKKLFDSDGIDGLLRRTEMTMTLAALDCMRVLKEKFGYTKIREETFRLIMGLPLIANILEKRIDASEGMCCCTDKTFYLLCQVIRKAQEAK